MTHVQDADGEWRQAIPLPLEVLRWTWLGPRFGQRCGECRHVFKTRQAYQDHYRSDHPLAPECPQCPHPLHAHGPLGCRTLFCGCERPGWCG